MKLLILLLSALSCLAQSPEEMLLGNPAPAGSTAPVWPPAYDFWISWEAGGDNVVETVAMLTNSTTPLIATGWTVSGVLCTNVTLTGLTGYWGDTGTKGMSYPASIHTVSYVEKDFTKITNLTAYGWYKTATSTNCEGPHFITLVGATVQDRLSDEIDPTTSTFYGVRLSPGNGDCYTLHPAEWYWFAWGWTSNGNQSVWVYTTNMQFVDSVTNTAGSPGSFGATRWVDFGNTSGGCADSGFSYWGDWFIKFGTNCPITLGDPLANPAPLSADYTTGLLVHYAFPTNNKSVGFTIPDTGSVGMDATNWGGFTAGDVVTNQFIHKIYSRGDHLSCASKGNISYGGANKITVCFWYWPGIKNPSTTQFIVESSVNYNNANAFVVYWASGAMIAKVNNKATGTYSSQITTTPAPNRWHHYAFVFDASTATGNVTVYVDGASAACSHPDTNMGGACTFEDLQLFLGGRQNDTVIAVMQMADFRIYTGDVSGNLAAIMQNAK